MKTIIACVFALLAATTAVKADSDIVASNTPLVNISTKSYEHDSKGYIWYSHEVYVTPVQDNVVIKTVEVNRGNACGAYPTNPRDVKVNYGQTLRYKFATRTTEVCDLIEIRVVTDQGDEVFKR